MVETAMKLRTKKKTLVRIDTLFVADMTESAR